MHNLLIQISDLLASLLRNTSSPIASLDRTIAAAGDAHFTARRALAVAVAEEMREIKRRETLTAKVADLEARAVTAIQAGYDELAMQASEAIASMAGEIDASTRASMRFAAEVALARREVDAQRHRLAELDRGRRLAKVGHALNSVIPTSRSGLDKFAEAEVSLERIRASNDDARAIREEMTPAADRLIENLSDIGLGEPIRPRPIDVMNRLRTLAAKAGHTVSRKILIPNLKNRSHVSTFDARRTSNQCAWLNFSYAMFGLSVFMVGGGIALLPLDWWTRAYFAMGMLMIVQSCFTLAKNVRDAHEASRMINRIEEARTEKLLSSERS